MSDITPAGDKAPLLSNHVYDVLKYVTQIVLPALGTLYFAMSQIWNWGHGDDVVGTITVIVTFLGVLLGLSTKAYNTSDAKYDGVINVVEDEDGVKHASLELKNYENPADVVQQKAVHFKVNPTVTPGGSTTPIE